MSRALRKKFLIGATSTLFLIGVFFLMTPFFLSMEPSAKARAMRSQHNISALSLGDYILEPYSRSGTWQNLVLIIKDWDGAIYLHLLPARNGRVSMPERWWGWGYYDCNNFGPEVDGAGKVVPGGNITCHDQTLKDWQKAQWVWNYKGESTAYWVENLPISNYEISGDVLYVNR